MTIRKEQRIRNRERRVNVIDYTGMSPSRLVAKSEEIALKWRQDKFFEKWYEQNGIEPFKRIVQESPNDQELEELLRAKIEELKYEEEKIAKVHNEEFWLFQIAAMRALREEAKRFCELRE